MATIKEGRRVGNSTRQIDDMVQSIFNDGWCAVYDHYIPDYPNRYNDIPIRLNLDKLTQRLYNEHDVKKEHLVYNKTNKTLTLKKSYYDRYK